MFAFTIKCSIEVIRNNVLMSSFNTVYFYIEVSDLGNVNNFLLVVTQGDILLEHL